MFQPLNHEASKFNRLARFLIESLDERFGFFPIPR